MRIGGTRVPFVEFPHTGKARDDTMRSFWITSLTCLRSKQFKVFTNYPLPLKISLSNDVEPGFASFFQSRNPFCRWGRSSEKLSDAITLILPDVVGGLYQPRLFVLAKTS